MRLFLRYLTSNLKLKVISLIAAIFIWFAIVTTGEVKHTIYVPVVVSGLKNDTILLKLDPEGVYLTLRGSISEIKSLKKNRLKVNLELAGFLEGYHTYHIERKNVVLPKGMKIEEIYPDTVAIEIDRISKKKLKVVVKLNEELKEKYSIESINPEYVEVVGAEKCLKDRTEIETLPFSVNGDSNSLKISVGLNTEGMVIKSVFPSKVNVNLVRREKK